MVHTKSSVALALPSITSISFLSRFSPFPSSVSIAVCAIAYQVVTSSLVNLTANTPVVVVGVKMVYSAVTSSLVKSPILALALIVQASLIVTVTGETAVCSAPVPTV